MSDAQGIFNVSLSRSKTPTQPNVQPFDTRYSKSQVANPQRHYITCQTIFERTLSAVSVDPNTLNKSPKPGKL